jgi:hypothetical protein
MAILAPDMKMRPSDVTGKFAVKNYCEGYTEWNCNMMGSDSFVQIKSSN